MIKYVQIVLKTCSPIDLFTVSPLLLAAPDYWYYTPQLVLIYWRLGRSIEYTFHSRRISWMTLILFPKLTGQYPRLSVTDQFVSSYTFHTIDSHKLFRRNRIASYNWFVWSKLEKNIRIPNLYLEIIFQDYDSSNILLKNWWR